MPKQEINNIDKSLHEEDFNYIQRILDGDNSAFTHLQTKYQGIVASLIRRMVKDEDDVMDLTQESFIKAYKALDSFQFGYSFSAWLYRIASNTCIDFLRKRRFKTISINKPVGDPEDDQYIDIKDEENQPDLKVLAEEKTALLQDAIEKLPENYREIIRMRHEQDLDYKEISEKLDLPLGTVKAHLFRARKLLYKSLVKKMHLFV